jgi:NADPH-dependent 7-cyano-7-deazaguanine reductase QueF
MFTEMSHRLEICACCPVSGNPLDGSALLIQYKPGAKILEVAALRSYIDSYQGGRGSVRSMEGMIQQIAQDCAQILEVNVTIVAELLIAPVQQMTVKCYAYPN